MYKRIQIKKFIILPAMFFLLAFSAIVQAELKTSSVSPIPANPQSNSFEAISYSERLEIFKDGKPIGVIRTKKPIIELRDVWKIYQMGEVEVPALRGVSGEIKRGDFVAIIGASGSGKSTMMNLIGCLDMPTKGTIHLKGQDITKMAESDLASLRGITIGFIFQQYNLMPNMTAFENVLLPLEFQDIPEKVLNPSLWV